MTMGNRSGRPSKDSVTKIERRCGVIGIATPAIAPTTPAPMMTMEAERGRSDTVVDARAGRRDVVEPTASGMAPAPSNVRARRLGWYQLHVRKDQDARPQLARIRKTRS